MEFDPVTDLIAEVALVLDVLGFAGAVQASRAASLAGGGAGRGDGGDGDHELDGPPGGLHEKLSIHDFNLIRQIGQGQFGKVGVPCGGRARERSRSPELPVAFV